jgi:hypothetical protein
VCLNNLRQIGQAFNLWASQHGNLNPWWIRAITINPGVYDLDQGTSGHPLDRNLFIQYAWISNELSTPRILACPSDQRVKLATDWGASQKGFMFSRDNSISYLLNLHSLYDDPQSLLSGDRNMRSTLTGATCSSGIADVVALSLLGPAARQWTNGLHGFEGNLLFTDGRVTETSNADIRAHITVTPNAFSTDNLHLLYPR